MAGDPIKLTEALNEIFSSQRPGARRSAWWVSDAILTVLGAAGACWAPTNAMLGATIQYAQGTALSRSMANGLYYAGMSCAFFGGVWGALTACSSSQRNDTLCEFESYLRVLLDRFLRIEGEEATEEATEGTTDNFKVDRETVCGKINEALEVIGTIKSGRDIPARAVDVIETFHADLSTASRSINVDGVESTDRLFTTNDYDEKNLSETVKLPLAKAIVKALVGDTPSSESMADVSAEDSDRRRLMDGSSQSPLDKLLLELRRVSRDLDAVRVGLRFASSSSS